MKPYCAKPYDVLFFRGNKPFHIGQWFSEGVFPPLPSTFQGLVRSKLLLDAGLIGADGRLTDDAGAKRLVGDDADMPLSVRGPFQADMDNDRIYFTAPRDLFRDKGGETFFSAFRKAGKGLDTDLDFNITATDIPDGKLDSLRPPGFITLEALHRYRTVLEDIAIEKDIVSLEERRVGIGLNDRRTGPDRVVEKRRFFVTPYNRLRDGFGFYFELGRDADKALINGPMKFGGESHVVGIEEVPGAPRIEAKLFASRNELKALVRKTRSIRLLLLQPGVFQNGWLPFDLKLNSGRRLACSVDGLTLELVSAFAEAPLNIGGYSYASNKKTGNQKDVKHKPIVKAVPAGAVYLFSIEGTDTAIDAFIDKFDNQVIANGIYSKMGFNHAALGAGPKINGG